MKRSQLTGSIIYFIRVWMLVSLVFSQFAVAASPAAARAAQPAAASAPTVKAAPAQVNNSPAAPLSRTGSERPASQAAFAQVNQAHAAPISSNGNASAPKATPAPAKPAGGQPDLNGVPVPWEIVPQFTAPDARPTPDVNPALAAGGTNPKAPAQPVNFHVVSTTLNSVTLGWDDLPAESGYKIWDWNWHDAFIYLDTVGADVTTYTRTGLECGSDTYYELNAFDGSGDGPHTTWIKATTQPCPPYFTVRPNDDYIYGNYWTAGNTVTVTVDDDASLANGYLQFWTQTISATGWFDFFVAPFDVMAGQYVTVGDGVTTRTMQVADLHFDTLNSTTNVATGRGPANATLRLELNKPGVSISVPATVGPDGNWSVDFSGVFTLVDVTWAAVELTTNDGDNTLVYMKIPNISVDLTENLVSGYGWLHGYDVSLSIDDPMTGPDPDYSAVASPDAGNQSVHFPLSGFTLQPGQLVSLASGNISRYHTVNHLVVTNVDVAEDTVSGTADPATQLVVGFLCDNLGCAYRWATADGAGNWKVDFSVPGSGSSIYEQTLFDIRQSTSSVVQAMDADLDYTMISWEAPVTHLELWHPYLDGSAEKAALDQVIANTLAAHPGLSITATFKHIDFIYSDYEAAVNAGGGPDMIMGPNDSLGNEARSGQLLNLDGYLNGKLGTVSQTAIDGMKVNGSLYGVPESAKAVGLYYNKSRIATPPTNTSDLIGLVKSGKTLFSPPGGSYFLSGFWSAFGGQLMDSNGSCIADQTGVPGAVQYLLDLHNAGADLLHEYGSAGQAFTSGNLDMLINGPWALADYRAVLGNDLGVVPLPSGPNGLARSMNGIEGIYINPRAGAPQGLTDLALYMTNQASSQVWMDTGGHIPVRSDVTISDPLIAAFAQASDQGLPRSQAPQLSNYWGPFDKMYDEVFSYKLRPWVAVQEACQAMNSQNGMPPTFGASFLAWPVYNNVHGYGWPYGMDVSITVKDSLGADVFTGNNTSHVASWDANSTAVEFHLDNPLTLQPGYEITMSGGGVIRTTIVSDLHITNIDPVADTMSGIGAPGDQVNVSFSELPGVYRAVTPGPDGTWFIDFAHPGTGPGEQDVVDIWPGASGQVQQWHSGGGGGTALDWRLPDPRFHAQIIENNVEGYDWPMGLPVTLSIDDPSNGPGIDFTDTRNVETWSNDPTVGTAPFPSLGGLHLTAGMFISMTNGTITKTATVTNLVVTGVDIATDRVWGTGTDGASIGVQYCSNGNCSYRRHVTVQDGTWLADFSVTGPSQDEQQILDITPGMQGEALQSDEDSDITDYMWHAPTGMGTDGAYGLSGPFGMAFDSTGNLFIANEQGNYVTKVTPAGVQSSFTQNLFGSSSVAVNGSDQVYVSDDNNQVTLLDADGNQTTWIPGSLGLGNPNAMAFDSAGNLYVVSANGFISSFNPAGQVINFQLANGLNTPQGIVVDNAAGELFVSDRNGNIDRINATTGAMSLYARTWVHTDGGLARDTEGNFYLSAIDIGYILKVDAATQEVTVCQSGLDRPRGLVFDASGRLYVTQYNLGVVNRLDGGCMTNPPPPPAPNPGDVHIDVWYHDGHVSAYDWPMGATLTMSVDDPGTPGNPDFSTTRVVGSAPWDINQGFAEFNIQNQFNILPGMTVSVEGAGITKELLVMDLTVTSVDVVTDIISGHADANAPVWMYYSQNSGQCCRDGQADSGGTWTLDYTQPGPNGEPVEDIHLGSDGTINARDDDGDNTSYSWRVANPYFNVRANEEKIEAWQWLVGGTLTITVSRAGESITRQTPVWAHAPWDNGSDSYGEYYFRGEFDIREGDLVTVTDGVTTKSTTVTGLAFDVMDAQADTVSGFAAPGSQVNIWACNNNNCINRHLTTDVNGEWLANWHVPGTQNDEQNTMDLTGGTWVDSSQGDDDGDNTMYGLNIPNPRIEVAPYSNWIHGREWPTGSTIDMTIDDPSNGAGVDYSASAVMQHNPDNPGDPNDFMAQWSWPSQFNPGPGYIISMTDGITAKTYTVSNLQVNGYDLAADLVSGTATPGAEVQVCVNFPNYCAARYTTADASGNWTVDYGHVGTRPDEQELVDIVANSTNGWASEQNASGDQTWYDWTAHQPYCAPGDSVAGAVYSADGTTPLQGAVVHFENYYTGDLLFTTNTGPDGSYNCALPDGNYRIWADDMDQNLNGLSREYYNNTIYENAGLVYVAAGNPVSGIDFSLDTPMFGFQHLTFNMADPIVSQLAVRQAIAFGTDREYIISAASPGATIPDSYMPASYWAYPTSGLPVFNYDPAHARQILADAGWMDLDSDGIREKDGVRLSIDYRYNTNGDLNNPRTRIAAIFAANMRDIGIEINLDDAPGVVGATAGIKQFAWAGIDLNLDNGPDMQPWAYYSSSSWNYGNYNNPAADALFDAANAVSTRAEKLPYLQQHQVQVMNDLAFLPLFEWGKPTLNYPSFSARLTENQVHGYGWPLGEQVTLTIDDPGIPGSTDFSDTQTVRVADWNPDETFAPFDLGAFTLKPGQTVTMTDGLFTKSHVVADLKVTNVDAATDRISGTAQPDSYVEVNGTCEPNMCATRRINADASGNWMADFSVPGAGQNQDEQMLSDIKPGDGNEARQPDNDGDNTVVQWRASRARPFYLKASPSEEWVHARGWANGAQLTLSVDDPSTPAPEDFSTTASMGQAPWDQQEPDDLLAIFDLAGQYDLKPGDVITVTDGVTSQTLTVPASLTQVRWAVGLGGYIDPAMVAAEQAAVDAFNQSRPLVEVLFELQNDQNTASNDMKTGIQNGTAPDVVGPVGIQTGNQFKGEWLDLTSLIASTGYDTSQFDPKFMQIYQTEDGQVGLPFMVFPSMLYYQKSLFDAAGLNYPPSGYGQEYVMPDGSHVEWNYDVMSEVGRLLTLDSSGRNATDPAFDRDHIVQYGYVPQWQSAKATANLWGAGDLYAGTPGSYTAEIPSQFSTAWQWLYNGMWGAQPFMPTGPVTNSPDFGGGNAFSSGKIAMAICQTWYLDFAGSNWDLAAIPSYMGAVNGIEHADNIRIWKGTAHQAEAFDFMRYLTDEAAPALLPVLGGVPARATEQPAYLAARAAKYPWVTNWAALQAGLNYVDIPSSESWMPNYDSAISELQNFQDKLYTDPSLDMTNALARLRFDLEAIFNGGQAHDPRFEVQLSSNEVRGFDWPAGNSVTLTIANPADPGTILFSDTQVSSAVDPWSPAPLVMFTTTLPPLVPGQLITLSDGTYTKTHIIQAFAVTNVDQIADKVYGTAAPDVTMRAWSHWPTCCSNRYFSADPYGNWVADFSVAGGPSDPAVDLYPNVSGQVAVEDADGDTTNLAWWVPDPAFGKTLPANLTTGAYTGPMIAWEDSAGATSYEYCIDLVDNNTCDTSWVSVGMNTSKLLAGLQNGKTYYWQARANNSGGQTEANAGAWWSFSTQPGSFNKYSPLNGSNGVGPGQAITWQASAGATSYEYCIDQVDNSACDGSWVNAGTATSIVPSGLSRAKTYYWQVRAVYAGGYTYATGGSWWTYSTAPTQFNKTSLANNTTGAALSPTLTWGTSNGATVFEYCLTTTVQTTGTVCDTTWTPNGTTTSLALSGLAGGTTYYWQVRAGYAGAYYYADAGNWWKFSTLALPGAFGKTTPGSATSGVSTAPTISWGASAGALSYEYCVDQVDNNTCDGSWTNAATATSKALSGLQNGKTYFWQVRAVNAGGQTLADSGTWWSFNTQPADFNKTSPTNASNNVGPGQAITWIASAGATSYEYCIDQVNNSACDGSWVNAGAVTSIVPAGLSRAKTYYWQVRAVYAGGYTYANSGIWWMYSTAPTQFNKLTLTNNTTGAALNPTLTWGASNGVTVFEYCLTTTVQTTGTACDTGWTANGTATSLALSGLTGGTTYYWQVRAGYAGAYYYADAGSWWKFSTLALPGAFGKTAPANAAGGISTAPTLSWGASSGSLSYEYCIDLVDNNTCDGTWTNNAAATSKALSGLQNGKTYFWQVRAVGAGGQTEADGGTWWSFNTQPADFNKTSPLNGSNGVGAAQAITWIASTGASSYEYCIDQVDNSACDGSWVNAGTATSIVPSGLSRARTYYWQVRAVYAGGYTYATGGSWWTYSTAPTQFNKASLANNTTGAALNPTLTWGASNGATVFEYCLTTTVQTTGTVCDTTWTPNGTAISKAFSGLAGGTTYYWQVRAGYAGAYYYADAGNWWKFSTLALPGAFVKTAPTSAATGVSTAPTISWAASTGALSYEYCIDQVNNSACDATWTSTAAATSKALSGLQNGKTYYWQVRAVGAGGQTEADGGAWWSFNTQPADFNKTSPTNAANNVGAAQAITWIASAGASSYEYCIDQVNNSACDGSWVNAGTATSAIPAGLSRAKTYYWQVRAVYAGGYTYANSGIWWMYSTAPTQFNKVSLANNTTGAALNPTLTWGASAGVTVFEYCLTTTVQTTGTTCDTGWTANGTATSLALSGLGNGTTYYWQVRAMYAGAYYYANAGSWWKFSTLP